MKKYNKMIGAVLSIMILFPCILSFFIIHNMNKERERRYRIEIGELQYYFEQNGYTEDIDVKDYPSVTSIHFVRQNAPKEQLAALFSDSNSSDYEVFPLYQGDELLGYVRYDYEREHPNVLACVCVIVICLILFNGVILFLLLWIKYRILKPFTEISELPYELSKGHLRGQLKESKNKYFGKFIWGLDMLRDTLAEQKQKELKLEREKKTLLLSISHDTKTPLSNIKLYATAMKDGTYKELDQQRIVAERIAQNVGKIQTFIDQVVKTSSTDLFEFEVIMVDFYLEDLMDKINEIYKEKCELLKISFQIRPYENHLIRGDINRLVEVFENIIENAIKYGDGKEIVIECFEEDYCQLIRVTNTGKPLRHGEFSHMFESFWRGDNANEKPGNGLGLYICKELLHKMDGEIFAEAKEDAMSLTVVLK